MIKTSKIIMGGLLALMMFSCSTESGDSNETKEVSFTESELNRAYKDNRDNKTITFVYDYEKWNQKDQVETAYVRGSFNSWKDEPKYEMSIYGDKATLTVDYEDIKSALGNSGHPEYKFVINGSYIDVYDKPFVTEPYCFHTSDNNLIVIFEGEDIEEIKESSSKAGIVWALEDWGLTDSLDGMNEELMMQFANFRKVPGTTCLYRSMHPFKTKCYKSSKLLAYETEPLRLQAVIKLYEKYGIKTDLNVSENYNDPSSLSVIHVDGGVEYQETIPPYYQALIDNDSVLNASLTKDGVTVTPEYKYIYQSAFNPEYLALWLKDILLFINSHEGPYNLHCRLGNDRTGFYSAVLAGLTGASWDEIAEDYQKSNFVYMKEYRDYRLLKQVFEKLYGVEDISIVQDLKALMTDYYIADSVNAGITEDMLTEAVARLTK